MKPEPRPHRASDNGARALLCASPTPTGQVPCCGLPPPGPATEPGREAQATASVGVCAGRSSCPTDRTACSGSPEPRTGIAKDLKIPCCRLGHTLAWTQRAEPWAGDMAWLGCCQGGRGCGHEGQEFLPCLPGHVQNSDVHTEALRVVPGPSSGGAGPLAGREGSGAARMLGLPSVYRLSQAPLKQDPALLTPAQGRVRPAAQAAQGNPTASGHGRSLICGEHCWLRSPAAGPCPVQERLVRLGDTVVGRLGAALLSPGKGGAEAPSSAGAVSPALTSQSGPPHASVSSRGAGRCRLPRFLGHETHIGPDAQTPAQSPCRALAPHGAPDGVPAASAAEVRSCVVRAAAQ